MENNQAAWMNVVARTETMVKTGTKPDSPEALAIAQEWQALLRPLAEADPSLIASSRKLYDNMADWPKDGPALPFSPEVWAFIKAAGETLKQRGKA